MDPLLGGYEAYTRVVQEAANQRTSTRKNRGVGGLGVMVDRSKSCLGDVVSPETKLAAQWQNVPGAFTCPFLRRASWTSSTSRSSSMRRKRPSTGFTSSSSQPTLGRRSAPGRGSRNHWVQGLADAAGCIAMEARGGKYRLWHSLRSASGSFFNHPKKKAPGRRSLTIIVGDL